MQSRQTQDQARLLMGKSHIIFRKNSSESKNSDEDLNAKKKREKIYIEALQQIAWMLISREIPCCAFSHVKSLSTWEERGPHMCCY